MRCWFFGSCWGNSTFHAVWPREPRLRPNPAPIVTTNQGLQSSPDELSRRDRPAAPVQFASNASVLRSIITSVDTATSSRGCQPSSRRTRLAGRSRLALRKLRRDIASVRRSSRQTRARFRFRNGATGSHPRSPRRLRGCRGSSKLSHSTASRGTPLRLLVRYRPPQLATISQRHPVRLDRRLRNACSR